MQIRVRFNGGSDPCTCIVNPGKQRKSVWKSVSKRGLLTLSRTRFEWARKRLSFDLKNTVLAGFGPRINANKRRNMEIGRHLTRKVLCIVDIKRRSG